MTDVRKLIASQLNEVDKQRARRANLPPLRYAYCGTVVTDAIAAAPNGANTICQRADQPLPENTLFYADSLYSLGKMYENRTYPTGPNVRRWREKK